MTQPHTIYAIHNDWLVLVLYSYLIRTNKYFRLPRLDQTKLVYIAVQTDKCWNKRIEIPWILEGVCIE